MHAGWRENKRENPKNRPKKKKKRERKKVVKKINATAEYTYTSIAVNMNQTMRNNPIAFDSSCGLEYAAKTPVPGMRMAE